MNTEIFSDLFLYLGWYIYPYILIYLLFLVDNFIFTIPLWIIYTIVLYILYKKFTKENILLWKIFLLIILLPISIIYVSIRFLFSVLNKFILFPMLKLEYPYIPIKTRNEIYELNELRKLKENELNKLEV